ncbi:hypothetical protein BDE02_04G071200 [Populus trichocarpa]|nr:hypothetical protein BDE02_04G071200 [Populus trichocarpa]
MGSISKLIFNVYKNVVSLGAMEKYIDCTQIQPYKCNKRLVFGVCEICKRRLAEPELYNYCSISCKVLILL